MTVLLVEVRSPATRKAGLGAKKELDARLGVCKRLFAGWRLHEGVKVPSPRLVSGGVWSAVLGA